MPQVRSRGRWVAALLLPLLLGGCANWKDYFVTYSEQVGELRTQLRTGHADEARKAVRESTPGDNNYLLDRLEEGRIALLAGDMTGSRRAFDAADKAISADDLAARYRVSSALQQGGSLLTNDQTIAYQPADFERTLLHHYLALDYLFANDRQGALVELRRANQEQEAAAERRARDVADAEQAALSQQLSQQAPSMDRLIGSAKSGFWNPYTFFFSALLYEADGNLNDAWVDLQRAYQLAPDQPSVQDALLRLARLRGSADELADIEKKVGRKAPPADPTSGQLVVLYEEGLIPLRRELWLPLPISTSAGDFRTFTVALPYYDNWSEPSLPLTISAGGVHGQASELGNIEALAAYDLKERLPGMVTRQLLRLFAKEQVRQVASQQANDIGNLVVGIFNTLSEHADTRSWSTLPARASVWSASLPAGSQSVELNGRRERVVINPGRTTLVWVNRVAPDLQIRTISL